MSSDEVKAKAKAKAKAGQNRGRGARGRGRGRSKGGIAAGTSCKQKRGAESHGRGRGRGKGRGRGPARGLVHPDSPELVESDGMENDGLDILDQEDAEPVATKRPAAETTQKQDVMRRPASKYLKKPAAADARVRGERTTFAGRRSPETDPAKMRFECIKEAFFAYIAANISSPSTSEASFKSVVLAE